MTVIKEAHWRLRSLGSVSKTRLTYEYRAPGAHRFKTQKLRPQLAKTG